MAAQPAAAAEGKKGQTLEAWLREKPFTLALCSSFFGFYAHCGVLQGLRQLHQGSRVDGRTVTLMKALEEHGLLPAKVTGSSAGALVAALWAGGWDASDEMENAILALKKEDMVTPFWRSPGLGMFAIKNSALPLPVTRLEAARVPIALSVFDVMACATKVHTQGPMFETVAASCCVPGLFQPIYLGGRPCVDGGVCDLQALRGCDTTERILSIDLINKSHTLFRDLHAKLSQGDPAANYAQLTRVRLEGLPSLGMDKMKEGATSIRVGKEAMLRALQEVPTASRGIARVVTVQAQQSSRPQR